MLIVQRKRDAPAPHDAELILPFEMRQKSRLRTKVASGEEIGLFLPRGTLLRDGDCLQADDGRVVRVEAATEELIEVRCVNTDALARAAYHLGNRHTPVQVGAGWLRLAADDVLAAMLRGLGAVVTPVRAPFEPKPERTRRAATRIRAKRNTQASFTTSSREARVAPDAETTDGDAEGAAAPIVGAGAPAAAREPDASHRCVQLLAGPRARDRGRSRSRSRARRRGLRSSSSSSRVPRRPSPGA
jgi:urease accessory protein